MLSTSAVGQARDNHSTTYKEYLGKGGFMEIKSNEPRKHLINCVTTSNDIYPTQWYFAELYDEMTDIGFFRNHEDADIHDYRDVLSWCVSILESSPSARLMLREATDKDWAISLEDLNGGDYCIDMDQKMLILDNNALVPSALGRSTYFRNVILVTLTKALRDIWQEKRHGGFDELYSPDYILLMERIRAADLDVMAIMVAWELRSEEYGELWRHLIGSDLGDMAMTYMGYVERDPSTQFNNKALLASFKQWFRCDDRLNRCDHDALEYMDDVIQCSNALNPFGSKRPGKMNIEMLSCLPDKTAYLQGQGAEILSDPVYASVDDDINQAHLMHIMHDMEAIIVCDVAFRDPALARKIFPLED